MNLPPGEGVAAPGVADAAVEGVQASALRVLFRRNFGPYLAGNLVSMCGTWFQNIAQALLIYRLTGSTFLVGVVNFAQFVGVFILGPWAGSAADRHDRRRLLAATQLAASGVSGILALLVSTHAADAPVVITFAFTLGLTTAFATPAQMALVPSLVGRADLASAVALNALTFNLARAIGPVTAALVVANLGIAWAFALNSGSYLALVVALAIVRPRTNDDTRPARPRLRESITVVARTPRLAMLFVVVAGASLSSDPVITLTPAFATEVFGRPDTVVGFLVGSFGAGAAAAALFAAGKKATQSRMVLSLAMLAAGILALAASPSFAVGMTALFVAGIGFLSAVTAATTALQLEIDETHRGRVMALWSMAFLGVRPFGSLIDGTIATTVGVRASAALMVVPAFLAAIGVMRLRTRERAKSRPSD